MLRRLIGYLFKIPDYIIWILATIIMAIASRAWVGNTIWLMIVYIPMIVFTYVISHSARLTGYMLARKDLGLQLFIFMLIALGLLYFLIVSPNGKLPDSRHVPAQLLNKIHLYSAFAAVGAILGALLRQCFGRLMYRTILERPRLGLNILALAIWTIIIIFMWGIIEKNEIHKFATPYFMWGLAAGMLIHRCSRWWFEKQVETQRRLQNIDGAWPPLSKATKQELKILDLFTRGPSVFTMKYKKLHKTIQKLKSEDKTKGISVINASAFRSEGRIRESITEIDYNPQDKFDPVDRHMLLMKAVSNFDLNHDDEGMRILVDLISCPSEYPCVLTYATKALRDSDEVLKDPGNFRESPIPLAEVMVAMEQRKKLLYLRLRSHVEPESGSIELFLSRFFDFSIPVRATFLSDVLGYCLLAGGHPHEARILFENCIEVDPYYASAYLHLGDYFLFRNVNNTLRNTITRRDLWHAEMCYYVAKYMEERKAEPTKTFRQASSRLEQVYGLKRSRS